MTLSNRSLTFYAGLDADHRSRSLDDVLAMDDHALEWEHNYCERCKRE